MTNVPVEGQYFIAIEEGIVPTRYRDIAGVDTWGIGHTASAGAPDPRKMSYDMPKNVQGVVAEAVKVFAKDLIKYEREVVERMGPMAPHELAGWVSWHFNTGGVFSSDAVALWKNGAKREAVNKLKQWNKSTVGGKRIVLDTLIKRRRAEADMILRGVYPDPGPGVPIWPTDGRGRVKWQALDYVTLEEYKALAGAGPTVKVLSPTVAVGAGGLAAAITFWDQIKGAFEWIANLFS